MTREQFITYLQQTLIPDLIKSGDCATAHDFKVAVVFLTSDKQEVDYDRFLGVEVTQ